MHTHIRAHTPSSVKQQGGHGYSKLVGVTEVVVMSVSGSLLAVIFFDSLGFGGVSQSSANCNK